MRHLLLLFFISSPVFPQDSNFPPEVATKLAAIQAYESIEGTWEGSYKVYQGPKSLSGVEVGVRITLKQKEKPKIYFKNSDDKGWEEYSANINFVPDTLGWHIYITADGGVWQERVFISAARVEEREVAITFSRTVHNWYSDPNIKSPSYYYVFGAGNLAKI